MMRISPRKRLMQKKTNPNKKRMGLEQKPKNKFMISSPSQMVKDLSGRILGYWHS